MSNVIQGSVVKNLGISVDNEIPRFDLITGKLIQTGSDVTISDSFVISRATTNSNLILDGNGTGVVQHNTGASSYQMPKSRSSTGILGPQVLRCAPASGDCDWYDLGALLIPYWQLVYESSSSTGPGQYFQLKSTFGSFSIWDGITPLGTYLFRVVSDTAASTYFSVDANGISAPRCDIDNIRLDLNTISTTSGNLVLSPTTSNLQVSYLTAGSVVFAGTSGKLDQDNNYLYWDNTNKRLAIGIGQETTIVIGGVTYGSVFSVHAEGAVDLAESTVHRHSDTSGFGAAIYGARSRGTEASESAVTTNDFLLRLAALGHDGTDYAISSEIDFICDNTVAANQIPGSIIFKTANSSGTLTTALTISSAQRATFAGAIAVGNLLIGGTANTIESTNANGNIILDPNGTGAIQLVGPTELGTQILKFSATNQASMFWDTGLVISPDTTSNLLTFGTATGTGSANIVVNKIGIGNSATGNGSTIPYINAAITGSGRGILGFNLTFTGAGNAAVVSSAVLTDQGSVATMNAATVYQAQVKLDNSLHTGGQTQTGFFGQLGYTTNFTASGGTYITYGMRLTVSAFGVGTGHTAGTFRRYGIFQDAMTVIPGTPTADLIMGCYFEDSINVITNTKLYFDSTSTALGTTYIYRSTANTRLEVYENATLVFDFDSTINKSEVPLGTLAGASTTYAKVGGTIEVNTTAAGTPASTAETDLQTYSVPASTMSTNGDSIYFEMSFTTAANANTKRLKIKYGATTMYDSTALALNGSVITARGRIIRTGAATQNYYVEVHSSSALLVATSAQGTAAETLSGAVTLKATGQNGTATANDLVQGNGVVHFHPNK